LPMLWALKHRVEADVFVVLTDSETWFNPKVHPVQALRLYRDRMGIPAKLVIVGMVANAFSIADPDDGGVLDVVGFDAAAPALIADLAGGWGLMGPARRPPVADPAVAGRDRAQRARQLPDRARGGALSLPVPPCQQTLDRRRVERRAELVDEVRRPGGQERVD